MTPAAKRLGARLTAWIAVELAWCAGFVDATCYIQLHGVYTSHMTGNTAALASHMLQRDWQEAGRYGWTIFCFVIGLLISASLTHAERRKGIRSAFAGALLFELALLAIFVLLGVGHTHSWQLLIFLPAAAMGVQTVTVTRVGSLRVYTTYLTGSLSKFSEALTEYLFWLCDRTRGRFRTRIGKVMRVTPRQRSAQQAAVTSGLWIAFVVGAGSGADAVAAWGRAALWVPMILLAGTVAVDLRWPVALGESSEEELRRPSQYATYERAK